MDNEKKMDKMNVTQVDPRDLLQWYDGQCSPQEAYIEIDWEERTITAGCNGEIGNSVPMSVWRGEVARYACPVYVAINDLLAELSAHPAVLAIADGGSGCSRLEALSGEIARYISDWMPIDCDTVWAIGPYRDWDPHLTAAYQEVAAESTDAELALLAEEIELSALDQHVELQDTLEALESLRSELADA